MSPAVPRAYLAGGTLARYAASGCKVSVLCATFGEGGRRSEYASLSRGDFVALRRRELEAACAALGVRPPLFLGCADQGLGRDCWDLATDEVVRTIRRLRPDVVLTFGPDGVSGHADHVALSQIVTAAFWGAGVTARWQGALDHVSGPQGELKQSHRCHTTCSKVRATGRRGAVSFAADR